MKKVVRNIADGTAGIDQTVSNMWRLINRDAEDPAVKKIALKLKSDDTLQTVKNIFKYTWKNHPYRSDPEGIEHFTAPKYLLSKEFKKYLDCDDLVGILAALLLAVGVPVRLKTIQWRTNGFSHIVLEFFYKNNWIVLDPTKKAKGFGNQVTKTINGVQYKQKIYSNPMGKLITLEDSCCGCGSSGRARGIRGLTNNNIINIGNKSNSRTGTNAPISSPPAREPEIRYRDRIRTQKVPYPVYKTVPMPVRTINTPTTKNYREFY